MPSSISTSNYRSQLHLAGSSLLTGLAPSSTSTAPRARITGLQKDANYAVRVTAVRIRRVALPDGQVLTQTQVSAANYSVKLICLGVLTQTLVSATKYGAKMSRRLLRHWRVQRIIAQS